MRFSLVCLLIVLSPALFAKAPALARFEFHAQAMAVPVGAIVYATNEGLAREGAQAAFARIRELDSILSDYDPESEVSRLCRRGPTAGGVPVSEDLWRVLTQAAAVSRASGGAFDVTVGPIVKLWREARRTGRLPDAERLGRARELVGFELVRLHADGRRVELLRPGVALDLGGIAKGYAAREALRILRERGASRALVDLGGDIAIGDPPPGEDGWRVAIAPYPGEEGAPRSLLLSGVVVATSGDAEQHVVVDGQRYSHIVDPRTGLGVTRSGSVTVVAPDGMAADALASAASVLPPEEGRRLVESVPGAATRILDTSGAATTCLVSTAWSDLEAPDAPPAAPAKAGDPTVTPPVSWMLEPTPLPAATATTAAEMKPYTETLPGAKVSFDMVPIPGGKFRMGSPSSEPGREANEGPQVEVEIEPFWMAKCEVTWDEYDLWGMGYDIGRRKEEGATPTAYDRLADAVTRPTKPYSDMTFGMGRERFPAISMTQLAAKVYCKWLSAKTGRYYRLPTEAEWEYACRAGTTTAYSFGDDPAKLGEYGWFEGNCEDKYHPVGGKKPNPWGLHDMHGNAAEWVLDGFTEDGYAALAGSPQRGPLTPAADIYPRVARGGCYQEGPDRLRSAARRASGPEWKMNDPQFPQSVWYLTDAKFIGFRVVRPLRTPDAEEAERYDVDEIQKFELADYLEFLAGRQ